MKTIKIFLASSDELQDDRNAFGNLVRRLDRIYEKQGIRIELFEWEDYDAAYNGVRKQDEYNEQIKSSDLFLALFYKKAGQFTIEEFNVATVEFKQHASPKIYTYCKDLQDGEQESLELIEFKKKLFEELGHYWCRYDNRDSMQLHFVMQLLMVENNQMEMLNIEDGYITFEGMTIAKIDNLKFAAANEEYQKMNKRLSELPQKIEKAQIRIEKFPNDEDLCDDLQQLLNEYNSLKDTYAKQQQLLFSTAKRIAQLHGCTITDRMRRAMDAFNEGNVREANIILNEAESDAKQYLEEYKRSRVLTEQKRQNVIISINELKLKTNTIIADISMPIEVRISNVKNIYEQADEMAREIEYDKEKYEELLFDFAYFLYEYAYYDMAIRIYQRNIEMREELYGDENDKTITSYGNLGVIYEQLGDYSKALEYNTKTLEVSKKVLGEETLRTAIFYNNVASVYHSLKNYNNAKEYYIKSLNIRKKLFGDNDIHVAQSYHNLGILFNDQELYSFALTYLEMALSIKEKEYGQEHREVALSYSGIGSVYDNISCYSKALDYYFKSLEITTKLLGKNHPDTFNHYNAIGVVYHNMRCYEKALKFYYEGVRMSKKVFGEGCDETLIYYQNIGFTYEKIALAYENKKDYAKALEYYFKVLEMYKIGYGENHAYTARIYHDIGIMYGYQYDDNNALEYCLKGLEIRKIILAPEHLDVAKSNEWVGNMYLLLKDYKNALKYSFAALNIYKKVSGIEHPDTLTLQENIKTIQDLSNIDN